MSLNENLKELMNINEMTTAALSRLTGINENTISSYLKTNGSMPPADKALIIAKTLKSSVEFLISGYESKSSLSSYDIHMLHKYSKTIKSLELIPEEKRQPILEMIDKLGSSCKK